MPTGMTGTLTGIFQNDQTSDPSYNGFYRFNYTVTRPGSWAADNSATWGGIPGNAPASLWAGPEVVVPPPATVAPVPTLGNLALLGLSLLLGLMVFMRRGRMH